jgi:hypothetical protein
VKFYWSFNLCLKLPGDEWMYKKIWNIWFGIGFVFFGLVPFEFVSVWFGLFGWIGFSWFGSISFGYAIFSVVWLNLVLFWFCLVLFGLVYLVRLVWFRLVSQDITHNLLVWLHLVLFGLNWIKLVWFGSFSWWFLSSVAAVAYDISY